MFETTNQSCDRVVRLHDFSRRYKAHRPGDVDEAESLMISSWGFSSLYAKQTEPKIWYDRKEKHDQKHAMEYQHFHFLMARPGGYPEISHSNLHFLRGFPSYVSTSRLSFRSCFRDFKAFIWGRWEFPVAEMGICHFANWHRSGKTMGRLRKTMVSLATSMSVYRTVNAKLICEWGSFHWHDEQRIWFII